MACGGCTCYFSFWAIFCTFSPLTARKIKMKKKMKKKKKKKNKKKKKKKTLRDIILHTCTKNYY